MMISAFRGSAPRSATRSLQRRAAVSVSSRRITTSAGFSYRNVRRPQYVVAAVISAATVVASAAIVNASDAVDYNAVRQAIADALDREDYDDGSLGPLFVRLAWHSSGSYSKGHGDGGSNGALIRFAPEKDWPGNRGLQVAVAALEPIHQRFPGISYGDLYTLAGVVAVEEMGGPTIRWRPGRQDHTDGSRSPQQDNRLPDGSKKAAHLRDVFYRMGFSDAEIVALSGAHALGRCHSDRSGFEGPWTRSPTTFSNEYFKFLLNEKWSERKWSGPKQYENSESGRDLMMLPSDIALIEDSAMRHWVEVYAADEKRFFDDFSAAFSKLLELGVSFHSSPSKAWWNRIFG